ncbi:MAG: hypothetical protein WAL20_02060, partial [Rhodomicrobium sp.]
MMFIPEVLLRHIKGGLHAALKMQRKPAAPVELELRLLKAKKQACRLQHFARRLISAQVTGNMLTDRSLNRNMT